MKGINGKRINGKLGIKSTLIGLSITSLTIFAQDEVYSSSYQNYEKEFTSIKETRDTNPSRDDDYYDSKYTKKEYHYHYHYYYDDYDYYYTARIRRFYRPIIGASYWCGYYVDYYFYVYDPFLAGVSIYVSYPFFRLWFWPLYFWWDWVWIDYYYDPFWWSCSYYRYPWWGYYRHNYWAGYWDGYWDGYWHGYWDGRWNRNTSCYSYNRYQNTISYHYNAPRGSEYVAGTSVWRTSGVKPAPYLIKEHKNLNISTPLSDIGIKVKEEANLPAKPVVESAPPRNVLKSETTSQENLSLPQANPKPQTITQEPTRQEGLQQEGGNMPPKHIVRPQPYTIPDRDIRRHYKGEQSPREHITTPQPAPAPQEPQYSKPKRGINIPQPEKPKSFHERTAPKLFENIVRSLTPEIKDRGSSNPEPSRPHRNWSSPSTPTPNVAPSMPPQRGSTPINSPIRESGPMRRK